MRAPVAAGHHLPLWRLDTRTGNVQERLAAADDRGVTQPPSDQPPYGAPPQPYGTPQPYAAPAQPYGAPPQGHAAPAGPYGAPAQPFPPGVQAYVGTPPGQQPAPGFAPPAGPPPAQPPIPAGPGGVVQHNAYDRPPVPRGQVLPSGRSKRPSGWNAPGFGLLALALTVVGIVLWPQLRARQTEAQVRPLVAALAQRDAGARCPRYITSVLTNVGSVSLDENGRIADRTDLTGPVCDGLRHFYGDGGKAELACLTSGKSCPRSALVSIVSLSVVVHESMHLRGQLDEGRAECESIGESQTLSTTLGIPLEQARMISWLHWAGMNPNTPPQYRIGPGDCDFVAALEREPPGTPESRAALAQAVNRTWTDLAS